MNLACKILASFLLICFFSSKGAVSGKNIIIWGALDHDINLDIPDFPRNNAIDDILWKKGKTKIAQRKYDRTFYRNNETYEIFKNGTLKIKHLESIHNDTYQVLIYDTKGKYVLDKTFDLRILETVSKPKISWSCINTTLTCEVTKGTDPELKLYLNGKTIREGHQKVIVYKWTTNLNASFNCTANNTISKETSTVAIKCAEKGLDFYLIGGICGGGLILIVFVILFILYISKRRKQNSRRNDEELEIRAHKVASEERGRKPHQMPGSTPQAPAASQPPPPPCHRPQAPGHRPQAPGHRPLPPGHRVQHQQQKRLAPAPGTQAYQQKGPPLPRPRVQPKPPRGATENL
ncbi:PREDICTED: T-cell surface antigen CD2 [Ceratotherium simum simum]|uniref:T-cell surface antigen CD2 n=1 Tax=Ceratotherium simum simum TaxID=73337 RepID=A0ABM0H6L9_CERSS|nr:PREDICTED: T-cell surface antigen CD2 [Ceratotherium simum simum]